MRQVFFINANLVGHNLDPFKVVDVFYFPENDGALKKLTNLRENGTHGF